MSSKYKVNNFKYVFENSDVEKPKYEVHTLSTLLCMLKKISCRILYELDLCVLLIYLLIKISQFAFIILHVVRQKENAPCENGALQEVFETDMEINSAEDFMPTFKDVISRIENVSIF